MPAPPVFRFGAFVLDVAAYELRHDDRPGRIERQPMDLLILLVERPRQLVTRGEIVDRLWGPDVFVDVEAGIHTAIRKVRQALGDTAERPTFVETVPGRGYRFIAGVELMRPVAEALQPPRPRRGIPCKRASGRPILGDGAPRRHGARAARAGGGHTRVGWRACPARCRPGRRARVLAARGAGRRTAAPGHDPGRAAVLQPERRSGARLHRPTDSRHAATGSREPERPAP